MSIAAACHIKPVQAKLFLTISTFEEHQFCTLQVFTIGRMPKVRAEGGAVPCHEASELQKVASLKALTFKDIVLIQA